MLSLELRVNFGWNFQTDDLETGIECHNVGEGVQDLYADHCWRGDWHRIIQYRISTVYYCLVLLLIALQYKIGQLYMIAKHSAEQSQKGEGVEVVENRPHSDPVRF